MAVEKGESGLGRDDVAASTEETTTGNRKSAPVFVKFRGEVSLHTASRGRKFLAELFGKGYSDVCVDLDELSFEDDAAFYTLSSVLEETAKQFACLCLVCTDWKHRKIFGFTGLSKTLRIFGDPMDALWYLENKNAGMKTTRFAVTWCDLSKPR